MTANFLCTEISIISDHGCTFEGHVIRFRQDRNSPGDGTFKDITLYLPIGHTFVVGKTYPFTIGFAQ